MTLPTPLRFKGAPGSPYTRKMLAYLRYRHIPYELLVGNHTQDLGLPVPKVQLLPTFYLPNAQGIVEAVVDSTPLIRRFEAEFAGRQAIPTDPVLRFINYLIEDYADEWLTKPMFHYRWYYEPDIELAGTILPHWQAIKASAAQLQAMKQEFAQRQISRLHVVGSNDSTAAVIEASYERFLQVMDALIQRQQFVLGERPASADFGIYGQLTQLTKFDPTPAAICVAQAPRVLAWTDLVDDLSGHPTDDTEWMSATQLREQLGSLLAEIGRVYAPVLLANASALAAGDKTLHAMVDGQTWTQPTFPYQAKCLQWINEAYRALDQGARQTVDAVLADTGCEALLR